MSITAVRLRPRDKRLNYGMATYVSANSRTKYMAGTDRNPSAFRVTNSAKELEELSVFQQFEILEFDDLEHLRGFIQNEMEERARVGLPAVRAAIMTGSGAGKIVEDQARPRKAVIQRLPAAVAGPNSDSRKTNTGRAPVSSEPREEAPVKAAAKPKVAATPKAPVEEKRAKQKKGKKKVTRKRSTQPSSDN